MALYRVLRCCSSDIQKTALLGWKFYQLMDLYKFKSPQFQKLLLELLQRKELYPQETIYKKSQNTDGLVLGDWLLYVLFCGGSHAPASPLRFQDVLPLPGLNRVYTSQTVGTAWYGFLELAWKRLQVNPYLIERLPNIPTPALMV